MKKAYGTYRIPSKKYMHYRSPKNRTEREEGAESSCEEILTGNFPNLGRYMGIHIEYAPP